MRRRQYSCSSWWDDRLIVSECEGWRNLAMGLGGWLTDCLITYCWYQAMCRQQYSCRRCWDDWLIVSKCEGCRNLAVDLGEWLTDWCVIVQYLAMLRLQDPGLGGWLTNRCLTIKQWCGSRILIWIGSGFNGVPGCVSGSGFKMAKMTKMAQRKRKKLIKFHLLKWWMFTYLLSVPGNAQATVLLQ
jgi:hypothetical protein